MALEKFKALIRTKAKELKANLSNQRIDAIAARLDKKFPDLSEDADHLEKIDDFNDVQPFADIAKDDDRIRTLEKSKGQSTKTEEKEEANADESAKTTTSEEPPAWFKKYQDDLKALQTKDAHGNMRTKLKDLLKDVPEEYYNEWTLPDKEEDVQAFADKVNTSWGKFHQSQVTAGLMTQTPPGGGNNKAAQAKADEAAIKEWAASKGAEEKK